MTKCRGVQVWITHNEILFVLPNNNTCMEHLVETFKPRPLNVCEQRDTMKNTSWVGCIVVDGQSSGMIRPLSMWHGL